MILKNIKDHTLNKFEKIGFQTKEKKILKAQFLKNIMVKLLT